MRSTTDIWVSQYGILKMVAGFHRLSVPKNHPAGVSFTSVNGNAKVALICLILGWHLCIYVTPSFIPTESELLQNEVSLVTAGEAVGAESKTPPSLRRRKRTCSRRQGDKEKDRELGGAAGGDRADRGVREHRDRREASESTETLCCCVCLFCFFLFSAVLP